MGAENSIYLGMYLEVSDGNKIESVVSYKDSNGNKTSSKFNPDNGEENTMVITERNLTVHPCSYKIKVDGFDDDEFFMPSYSGAGKGVNTWVCNGKDFNINVDCHQDLFNLDLSFLDFEYISNVKKEFMEYYEKYLEELGKEFKYVVKFGLVYYAH